ncbi:MAG: UvrD-helicase domain-containing protein [Gammaproteobacteria bacterium]|nr:UvrD-helicase domain-containing protein [Gammaproteobacteria bacterium]
MQIADAIERKLALNLDESFIVKAPAGSGKTTLLVERYLALLAKAKYPEEIVAITFTKKAANKMRNLVLAKLRSNKNILSAEQLAKWQLLENPNRLKIQTIDSLCNSIAYLAPLSQNFVVDNIVSDLDAELCYEKAAALVLENLSLEDQKLKQNIELLLLHLNNDQQYLIRLFVEMLKIREQWLPYAVSLKNHAAKTSVELKLALEACLKNIVTENLSAVKKSFPKNLIDEFSCVINFAANQLSNRFDFKKDFFNLKISDWQQVGNILMTKDFTWRKKLTKDQGFLPATLARNMEEKQLFKSMKERGEILCEALTHEDNFKTYLTEFLKSPPTLYSEQQWQIVCALLELLPILVAQLKVEFKRQNLADYAEISMAALYALGEAENPTDLALNLDLKIKHLLVDEFQDTSIAQFRLLEKLTLGWQPGDGRTLFLVGDPMQSIYRFREAEVGLFLRAIESGIGSLKLTPITLTTNFRSNQNLVNFVNEKFSLILPQTIDNKFGAVPFTGAIAANPAVNYLAEKICLLPEEGKSNESFQVLEIIKQIQTEFPGDEIAILVKARSHSTEILKVLREANINFQAVELETLIESEVIQDLFALTRALLHPLDRIAWLAILRAPWCGLELADLLLIANGQSKIIWENIQNFSALNLSSDGKCKIARFMQIIKANLPNQFELHLRDFIEETWYALSGPACVSDEAELENAKVYLELLETNDFDILNFEKKLTELYAPPTAENKIQVMTIHKAKGLDFDHVIVPRIDRATRTSKQKLMLLHEIPGAISGSNLVLAPIHAATETHDPIYKYLTHLNAKKDFYETGRLLYVAATRAKKTLHLVGCAKNPASNGSLLKQLEPCFSEDWILKAKNPLATTAAAKTTHFSKKLQRLVITADSQMLFQDTTISSQSNETSSFKWQDNTANIIGTVVHKFFYLIAEDYLQNWNSEYLSTKQQYCKRLLMELGCQDIQAAKKTVFAALNNTLNDERGRWILTKHQDAASELALTSVENSKPKHLIIDRTFVTQDGFRFIIDYKTSDPNQVDIEQYRAQLEHYRQALSQLDNIHPIKLGLYFPLFTTWIEI